MLKPYSDQKIIDHGWSRIMRSFREIDRTFTKVGLPDSASVGHGFRQGSGHEPAEDMSEIIIVGAVHEFGAPRKGIPARPFIRPSYDKNKSDLQRIKAHELGLVIDGKKTVKGGLAVIGEWLTNKTKQYLTLLKVPPLKPLTIARKKSSNPLIDTGQLRNSITHIEVTHV